MTSVDHVNSKFDDLRLAQYATKSVELNVIKDITAVNYDILQQKEIALKEEYKALDDVNYNVWVTEDTFCNEVWKFSSEHNFDLFINQYPDVTSIDGSHKCQYNSVMLDDTSKIDILQGLEQTKVLNDLKQNIDAIKNEIIFVRSTNVEKEIKHSLLVLNELERFSERIFELLRVINIPQESHNINNTLVHLGKTNIHRKINRKKFEKKKPLSLKNKLQLKQLYENSAPQFLNARKLIKKRDFHSNAIIGEEVSVIRTETKKFREYGEAKENVKFGKFIMKRQSHISLKLEQTQRHVK